MYVVYLTLYMCIFFVYQLSITTLKRMSAILLSRSTIIRITYIIMDKLEMVEKYITPTL